MSYEERDTALTPGDSLLMYSDGLIEARNPERQMFGNRRLSALVGAQASHQNNGGEFIRFLLESLADFVGAEREQEDDVTLVIVHRFDPLLSRAG